MWGGWKEERSEQEWEFTSLWAVEEELVESFFEGTCKRAWNIRIWVKKESDLV